MILKESKVQHYNRKKIYNCKEKIKTTGFHQIKNNSLKMQNHVNKPKHKTRGVFKLTLTLECSTVKLRNYEEQKVNFKRLFIYKTDQKYKKIKGVYNVNCYEKNLFYM